MDLNNQILFIVLLSLSIFSYNYLISILNKKYPQLLIDDQLNKPQAFHQSPVSITGGVVLFFSFLIVYFDFSILKKIYFLEYFLFCSLFFLLGFVDDLKINIKPKIRLTLMIIFLIILVKYNNFYIDKTGINFLNNWLEGSEIFSLIFVCLCFLFIINGANLIDGYNGLLGFHSLIILTNLFFINFFNGNNDLANFLFFIIITLIIFIWFNFPKAKVFLGDSGSYFLGAVVAISAIKTSALNPSISPFYFCILLFYLFFEVFFSFFRKLARKKSPLHPDPRHLHMLLYKILLNKSNNKIKSNYSVSIIINSIYLALIIPAIFMMKDGLFCKYYSIIFFITYIISYKIANENK